MPYLAVRSGNFYLGPGLAPIWWTLPKPDSVGFFAYQRTKASVEPLYVRYRTDFLGPAADNLLNNWRMR